MYGSYDQTFKEREQAYYQYLCAIVMQFERLILQLHNELDRIATSHPGL